MKYNIKVGEKYLVGESASETIKGTVRGDTTAVYSRYVGEMSKYDFCKDRAHAESFDRVTACDYVLGIMERQNYGFYLGEIKLIDSNADETVAHCVVEKNARLIAHIMEFDAIGKEYDWYEQHIEQILERQKAEDAPEWISVEDKKPDYDVKVLVCWTANGEKVIDTAFWTSGGWAATHWTAMSVTHWMPLPEPPADKKETDQCRK